MKRASLVILTLMALSVHAGDKKVHVAKIHGKIQFVNSFGDYKVQVVTSFPDLRVQIVDSFPDKPGQWQIVDSFPDYKIEMVNSFPDFTIQYVKSFPFVSDGTVVRMTDSLGELGARPISITSCLLAASPQLSFVAIVPLASCNSR